MPDAGPSRQALRWRSGRYAVAYGEPGPPDRRRAGLRPADARRDPHPPGPGVLGARVGFGPDGPPLPGGQGAALEPGLARRVPEVKTQVNRPISGVIPRRALAASSAAM